MRITRGPRPGCRVLALVAMIGIDFRSAAVDEISRHDGRTLMARHDATALAGISFASRTEKGDAFVFGLIVHQGNEYMFAFPPEAVGVFVARLLAAAQRSAIIRQQPTVGIVAKKSEISVDEEKKIVGLELYPTEQTGIPFALDPQHAQKISSDLAHAAAKVRPRKPKKQN